jgi:Caspase domain
VSRVNLMKRSRRVWVVASVFLLVGSLSAPSGAQEARLWVIMEADLVSPDIAGDMRENVKMMDHAFKANVGTSRLRLFRTDERFGRNSIQAKLTRIANDSRANDAIVFIYCGHGAYDPRFGTFFHPTLDRGNPLYLSEVRAMVKQLNLRLSVTILDCCNTYKGPVLPAAPAPRPPPEGVTPLFQKLFFDPAGEVVLNSSAPGQVSVTRGRLHNPFAPGETPSYAGSLFISELSGALVQESDEIRTWPQFVPIVQEHLDLGFRSIYPDGVWVNNGGNWQVQRRQTIVFINNLTRD